MSFWVHGNLEITGDELELDRLKKKIKDNKIIDSLYPIPEDFVVQFQNDSNISELLSTKSVERDNLLEKMGSEISETTSWRKWSIANRGTVWGDNDTKVISLKSSRLEYEMFFKNVFPYAAFLKISEDYPNLLFRFFDYSDDSMEVFGEILFKNGILTDNLVVEEEHFCEVDESRLSYKANQFKLRYLVCRIEQIWRQILKRLGLREDYDSNIPF